MKKTIPRFENLPASYEALCRIYLPRPIHDKVDFDNSVELVNTLAGHALSVGQEDYLEALSIFIEEYETPLVHEPHCEPRELLGHLLEENGLGLKDLAKILGVDSTHAGRIAKGKRTITLEHARKLGERFKLPAGLFLGINK
jgi:HTH-type transcriptional regulator / antitoxin HigA